MKQTLTRLALTLPVVWLVVSLVFLLIHLVPGDPIQMMLGEGASPVDVAALRHQYGFDRTLGLLTVSAISNRDYALVQGCLL
jgi:peptide/nickel transport system permease protein